MSDIEKTNVLCLRHNLGYLWGFNVDCVVSVRYMACHMAKSRSVQYIFSSLTAPTHKPQPKPHPPLRTHTGNLAKFELI